MAMTVAEARSEIKSLFDKANLIEKRYPDGEITNNEDAAEVKRVLGEIDGLESKLASLEDAETRRNRIMAGIERYSRPAKGQAPNPVVQEILEGKSIDPGRQFIESRDYRELRNSGAFKSALNRVSLAVALKDGTSLVEWKTLLTSNASSGGGFVMADRQPGLQDLRQREIVVLDLIPRIPTESDTIEYVREDTFTNNAAFTAEATETTGTSGVKPESALAYSKQTAAVKTLPHWIPVTNRMLDDAPAIRGTINSRLLLGLNLTLETQIISGNGSGENLTGILSASPNSQGLGDDNVADAIYKGRTKVRVVGHGRPTAVLMHPNDWEAVRLLRENAATGTLGNYLMGPPSQVGATTLWGLPVLECEGIAENTAIVGDFAQGCALFDREQAAIRVGTIDDQFVRNMQTILAELRVAFVVYRPTMFTAVTGI